MGSRIAAFKRDEEVWLVKSGDRVTGPFSTDELSVKIKNREIAIIDEVIAPMSRWKYVRDEPEFASAVEETRKGLMTGREDTEIQGHTQTPTHFIIDEPETVVIDQPESMERGDIIVDAPPMPKSHKTPASADSTGQSLRQYGVSSQTEMRKRISRFALASWVVAIVVLAFAVHLMFRASAPRSDERHAKTVGYDTLVTDGDQSWQIGRFEDALRSFRQANQLRPGNPEISPRLAALLIQVEGQTVAAKRVLFDVEALSAAQIDANQKRDVEIGYGLAALFGEDYTEAQNRFRGVLSANPQFFPAVFNMGMTWYRMKSLEKAMAQFQAAGDEPAALIMTGITAALQGKALKPAARKEAEKAIQRLVDKHFDFQQEGYVVGAILDLDSGKPEAAGVKVRAALDVDPELTQDHWHDPALFLDPIGWRSLLPFCRRLNDEIKSVPARALMAYCLGRVGEREDASKIVSDALGSVPEDQLLHSVNAYLLFKSGRIDDARGAVRMAGRAQSTRLATIIRARLCVHASDNACTEEAWRQLATVSPPMLAPLAGLADVYRQVGKKSQSEELILQALTLSPRYLPALRLRGEAGTQ